MKSKQKGSRLERKTIFHLTAAGYLCIRSAGSLGPFDVVAINSHGIKCIQVKCNTWPRPAERQTLRNAAKALPPNAVVECWKWDDGARKPIIKLISEWPA